MVILSSFVYMFLNVSVVYMKFLTVSKNLKNTKLEQDDVGIVG